MANAADGDCIEDNGKTTCSAKSVTTWSEGLCDDANPSVAAQARWCAAEGGVWTSVGQGNFACPGRQPVVESNLVGIAQIFAGPGMRGKLGARTVESGDTPIMRTQPHRSNTPPAADAWTAAHTDATPLTKSIAGHCALRFDPRLPSVCARCASSNSRSTRTDRPQSKSLIYTTSADTRSTHDLMTSGSNTPMTKATDNLSITAQARATVEELDRFANLPQMRVALRAADVEARAQLQRDATLADVFIPLDLSSLGVAVPAVIGSARVVVTRGVGGSRSECHQNSVQYLLSLDGAVQTHVQTADGWRIDRYGEGDPAVLENRWHVVAPGVWHKTDVASARDWSVAAFHSARKVSDEYR